MTTGPQRITAAIENAREEGRAALLVCVPFVKESDLTRRIVNAVVEAGADMVEFQFYRFINPLPRALTFAYACQDVRVPVLIMCDFYTVYFNSLAPPHPDIPIRLVPAITEFGIDGIAALIPDELIDEWTAQCGETLAPVMFVNPSMTPEDFEHACRKSKGFVYLVGVEGSALPGASDTPSLSEMVRRIRQFTDLPIITGAGIQTAKQAAMAGAVSDGVATATAISRVFMKAVENKTDPVAPIAAVVRKLRRALHKGKRPRTRLKAVL